MKIVLIFSLNSRNSRKELYYQHEYATVMYSEVNTGKILGKFWLFYPFKKYHCQSFKPSKVITSSYGGFRQKRFFRCVLQFLCYVCYMSL